jgi:hypothetical protein
MKKHLHMECPQRRRKFDDKLQIKKGVCRLFIETSGSHERVTLRVAVYLRLD